MKYRIHDDFMISCIFLFKIDNYTEIWNFLKYRIMFRRKRVKQNEKNERKRWRPALRLQMGQPNRVRGHVQAPASLTELLLGIVGTR